MMPVGKHCGFDRTLTDCDELGLRDFAKLCVRSGTTTVTDLASRLTDEIVEMMLQVTSESNFPMCLVPLRFFIGLSPVGTG